MSVFPDHRHCHGAALWESEEVVVLGDGCQMLSASSWKLPHTNVSELYCLVSLQVFHLKPGLSLRSTFLAQFLLVLHRKALTLIKYIEDDT